MGILFVFTPTIFLPLATLLAFFITPRYQLIFFFLLGVGLSWMHEYLIKPVNMPDEEVIPYALIEGTIASIPVTTPYKTQFSFAIHSVNHKKAQGLVQLAWYNKRPEVHAGQVFRLAVKLKKPRNFHNPGSSDYVSILASKHIGWTGYVRAENNQLLQEVTGGFNWLVLREKLGETIRHMAPNRDTAGILEALTLNLNTDISQDEWELFRRTGTTHLFGISGEHIALIAGLFFGLLRWLWSRSEWCSLRIPSLYVASMGGLCMALVYSLLAGFGPPVQRALIGFFFYTVCCLGKQKLSSWQIWRYAFFAVLCIEPHAVFMQGFYFSFLAVVCLLLTQQRFQLKGYKANLALQLSCLLGLMPLGFYWFSYGSINGYIANLFAIPLVGLLIVPLALLALLFSSFSWVWVFVQPASYLIALLLKLLHWTESLSGINIHFSLHTLSGLLALIGALLMGIVLPIRSLRWILVLWIIIPFMPERPKVLPGEALIQVLDVGQGLAVSIQTAHHVLLYDTGDKFFNDNDLGKMVVLPYFNRLDIKQIDTIVISHPDQDHRGGLASIAKEMPGATLLVNDKSYYKNALNCHAYPPWEWDGVHFRFLPISLPFKDKNNTSCILQVSTAAGRVLFTGDIEKLAEDYLVRTYGTKLAADYLIVPHHGSKTSSSYRFLLEVSPQYAIASLGFDNRFHFPHEKTLANMQSLGIDFFRTDACGMVSILLKKQGDISKPVCFI